MSPSDAPLRSRIPLGPPRLCTLLLGLACFLATAVSVAAKSPDRLLMAFPPNARYESGHWYLVPQPWAAVKAELEKGLEGHGLRGCQWRGNSAALASLAFYWMQVSLLHRPDLQQGLSE